MIPLAGQWRFDLDRADVGVAERWFARRLPSQVQLPGALQNQGFGDRITVETKWTGEVGADRWRKEPQYAKYRQPGNIKLPFFLQPERHYVGAAWYQRDLEVPASWAGRRVVLTLERAHWETQAWLDGEALGTRDSLSTPHVYDLGTRVRPGRHTLTVRVDNRIIVGVGDWSHSVSDHTQGNWNGIIGRLDLTATSPVWIDDLQAFPDLARRTVRLKATIGNATGQAGRGTLSAGNQAGAVQWDPAGGAGELEVTLGTEATTWDEFNPALYELTVRLRGDAADNTRTVAFGLREISASDRQFRLNGRPAFLRGTLECCIFPQTGYPPTAVADWERVIRVCQAHGLNHIRFHSWCPPEAAFRAADKLGFYYQVECGVWTLPGDGKPIDQWIYDESERIVRAYGNHPSFLLLTHGNEPHGPNHEPYLARWVNHWKAKDSRRLVTSGSAYPSIPENQYHVTYQCRGPHGWLGKDYQTDVVRFDVPVIVHEMGQWCVFPNLEEVRKYHGPLQPRNFEIYRESLADHGLLRLWPQFLRASGKLQTLCYKEEIEAALRTPGIGGFQLLDLHDFPGQGTALVGVLDPFWDSKGYVTPAEYRRFCGPTVPLARLLKRTWTTDETVAAEIEVAHFGSAPLPGITPTWALVSAGGPVVAAGELPRRTLPLGSGIGLGRVRFPLHDVAAPGAYRLVVRLGETGIENDWGLWVYPATTEPEPHDVLVSTELDDAALARLEAGGKVLLATARLGPAHAKLGFEPIFWNRYMFNTQERQTLGLLCDPDHPALARFPTESWQDWQWRDIVTSARGMVLDALPRGLRPVVQVIDDWNTNRRLGLIVECRVGQGRLVVCSADLGQDLGQRPAARQLRASLLAYMSSERFKPRTRLTGPVLRRLLEFTPPSALVKLGARVIAADSEDRAHGNLAAKAIDGDPTTLWHTCWQPHNDPMPHWLVIDLGREFLLKGLTYQPRLDQANGRIAEAEVFCTLTTEAWGNPVAQVTWPNTDQPQTVTFPQPAQARYLKLVVKSEVNRNPFASLAELDVILDRN